MKASIDKNRRHMRSRGEKSCWLHWGICRKDVPGWPRIRRGWGCGRTFYDIDGRTWRLTLCSQIISLLRRYTRDIDRWEWQPEIHLKMTMLGIGDCDSHSESIWKNPGFPAQVGADCLENSDQRLSWVLVRCCRRKLGIPIAWNCWPPSPRMAVASFAQPSRWALVRNSWHCDEHTVYASLTNSLTPISPSSETQEHFPHSQLDHFRTRNDVRRAAVLFYDPWVLPTINRIQHWQKHDTQQRQENNDRVLTDR